MSLSVDAPLMAQDSKTVISPFDVLVIDDNEDFLQILGHLIDAMGHTLYTSTTAMDGLDIARNIMPDIIFCDLELPGGMHGFDFARSVRNDDKLRDFRMIAISGYTDAETQQQALLAGFDDIFPKPVKFADIRMAIEYCTKGLSSPSN